MSSLKNTMEEATYALASLVYQAVWESKHYNANLSPEDLDDVSPKIAREVAVMIERVLRNGIDSSIDSLNDQTFEQEFSEIGDEIKRNLKQR